MSEWRVKTLGELIHVKHGFAFKGDFFSDEGEKLVLKPGNFPVGGGIRLRPGKDSYYSGRYPQEFELAPGDLLVVMTDLTQSAPILGSPAFVPDAPGMLHNQRLGLVQIKPDAEVDRRFLYYAMLSDTSRSQIRATATGATVRHTAPERIYQVALGMPGLAVQRVIADVLGSIDDLIENNRRRVQILEGMARAIYREWFVKFRYPGHEGVTLVDSALGSIPEGWETRTVGQVAGVVRGRSYKSAELVDEGGLPFVNLKCMARGGGFRRDGLKRYIGKYKEEQLVGAGDLVLAVTDLTQGREILARATLVPRLGDKRGVISLDVIRLVPVDEAERLWLFASLAWSNFADRLKEFANGSTVLHLSPGHVVDALTLWPPEAIRKGLVAAIEPCLAQIEVLSDQVDSLGALRDLLLPKLVTGQIDVSTLDLDGLLEGQAA